MRRSAAVTAAALRTCIGVSRPGMLESDLAAVYEFQCRLAGAAETAFPPVVGSGRHACTVHYSRNDRRLRRGDSVLMDAGCELAHYASDVTRTWPLGGFSHAQRLVYDHVLRVHQAMLAAVRPGATLAALHRRSVQMLAEALADLGVGRSTIAARLASHFYPHALGHWLGADVHDCSDVARSSPLEPGVVLTIEPGLYMRREAGAPREFADIGVRIEDVVLVRPFCRVGSGRAANKSPPPPAPSRPLSSLGVRSSSASASWTSCECGRLSNLNRRTGCRHRRTAPLPVMRRRHMQLPKLPPRTD